MLLRLQIQNFALIQNLSLEFDPRLNVFTGETGAGKSILIDALCFALGERYDGRKPQAGKTCAVEAVFEIPKALVQTEIFTPFFEEGEEVIILRRELNSEGRNRSSINNRTVTNGTLKQAGDLLIDIHGQHAHQLLLDPASHLNLVDRLAKIEKQKDSYFQIYFEYRNLVQNRNELLSLEQTREREIDLLKYQIEEIEKPDFSPEEEDELKLERIRLANAEKLYESAARILQYLNDEEICVSSLLGKAAREMTGFTRLDPSMEELKGEYENAQLGIEELIRSLKDYQEKLSFDGERLNEIDKRMDQIDLVKCKYGGSLKAALDYLKEAKLKYDKLINSALYGKEIDQKIDKLKPRLKEMASELTEKRQKTAGLLKKTIETELGDLNIPHSKFECRITPKDFEGDGADAVEFLISLNPGQDVMPLAKIISGGEASRVMLALKKALMKVDPVPTLIFDEIDANIGGRLGQVTGQKLKEISGERQVLLITHLPQIASFADRHFKVTKNVLRGQTSVDYKVIDGDERVRELSQMMSGKNETEISKKHAAEMLKSSQ